MKIRRYFLLCLIVLLLLMAGACKQKGIENPDKGTVEKSFHVSGQNKGDIGFVPVIKKQTLANFPSATIGDAFDSYKYFTKKEWKEEQLKSGHTTVDISGWFGPDTVNESDVKNGVKSKGIDVKFVINPDGSYYVLMISKIEARSDGKIYGEELKNNTDVLAKIYANKKISL